ncbi:hypothetical protein Tco_0835022 [Tanacetum coccineum]
MIGTLSMSLSLSHQKIKRQIQQEEASLAEAIRLQTLEEEEIAKQDHLDTLLAKRMEEEELTEQQKQRKAQYKGIVEKIWDKELHTEISKKQRIDVSDTEEKVGKVKEE